MPEKAPTKARSVVGDVNLSFFGIINLTVDLFATKDTVKSDFSLACPDCTEPTKLSQKYVCPTDAAHGPFTTGDAARVKEIDGALYHVSPDEIEALKTPTLPPKDAVVDVFPAAQVERMTRPTGTSYRVGPKVVGQMPIYSMVRDLVADQEYAYVLELTARGQQKMYRVESWDGHVVLQELCRPEEVRHADPVTATYDGKVLQTATTLAAAQATDFDPEAFRSAVRTRITAFEAEKKAGGGGAVVPAKAVPTANTSDALLAALEAAVAAKAS